MSITQVASRGISITQVASRGISIGKDMALVIAPHGGQLRARRNALRALTADQITAATRADLASSTAALVTAREQRDVNAR